jgi:hypothetical protein
MGRLHKIDYLTLSLRSVSSLNNPQNSEMKICENMKLVDMLKIIIIIIIGYNTLNNFTTHVIIS